MPRRTCLERSAVGKLDVQIIAVDTTFVVIAADHRFRINRIDRYLALILNGGIDPGRVDQQVRSAGREGEWQELEKQIFRRHPAVEVLATSLVTGMGLDQVRQRMKPVRLSVLPGRQVSENLL